jgi:hypothetical protein
MRDLGLLASLGMWASEPENALGVSIIAAASRGDTLLHGMLGLLGDCCTVAGRRYYLTSSDVEKGNQDHYSTKCRQMPSTSLDTPQNPNKKNDEIIVQHFIYY